MAHAISKARLGWADKPAALLALSEYLASLPGGSADLVRGWTTRTAIGRTGDRNIYYHDEDGTKYRSRGEVAESFGLVQGRYRQIGQLDAAAEVAQEL